MTQSPVGAGDALAKSPSGIKGFDDITLGGLPSGRPTLVSGGAGSGKTLFAMEFLVRGAVEFGEPGVFMSFEESERDLSANFASLGFDLASLQAQKKISLEFVHIDRAEIEETGEFDLEGLFVRLGFALDSIGAKRVVLDTIEALFSGFENQVILRAEIRRLFRWLKDRGVTAVITAERGNQEGGLTRHGLEEYVSDCVIALDHRVNNQVSTRRLRVVKYRGSRHGTNEYPFLMNEGGLSVLPITSVGLDYPVTSERVSTGIPSLDDMFGGQGVYRGSSVLVSGTAGTGKTSFASTFVDETCRRGIKCLYFAFEESSRQILRNMQSIGLDLSAWMERDLLRVKAVRPTLYGLEMHLAGMLREITDFAPGVVVIDPISNLTSIGNSDEVKIAIIRLVDLLKSRLITSMFTSLVEGDEPQGSQVGVSSLMDTWIQLKSIEGGGEHNRVINILKSRGTAHSNQIREFMLTSRGIELVDLYNGPCGVLTGSARLAQESREKAQSQNLAWELERRKRDLQRKRQVAQARIAELQANMQAEQEEVEMSIRELEDLQKAEASNRESIGRLRTAGREAD